MSSCHLFKQKVRQKATSIVLLLVIGLSMATDLTAEAKKKADKVDPAAVAAAEAAKKAAEMEAEIKKGLEPINEELTKLMVKTQARNLFSPKDAGQLVDIKYKLLDLMDKYPQNAMLAKPVYQAGVLFSDRDAYNDAYELFHYLAQGYTTNAYGAKAKGQIQILERKFGANYFSVEMAVPEASPPASEAATATADAKPGTTPAPEASKAPASPPAKK